METSKMIEPKIYLDSTWSLSRSTQWCVGWGRSDNIL